MISKRKRNTVLAYCMASVVMLCALASNVTKVTTSLKTNSKKIVADNQVVETTELSYGLVALEASSCIEENKDAQNVTEEKKEDKKEEAKKADENKKTSSAKKKTTTKKKSTTSKKKSTKTKKNKAAKKKTTTKKTTIAKKKTTAKKTTTKTAAKSTATTSTANSSKGTKIANYAKKFVGKSYRMGGSWNGELPYKATDCSGFTQGVYKHFGISLPRVARQQAKVGKKVSWNALQPGDLVFYSGNGGKSVTHVAIYIGKSKIVHAQTPSLGIGITTSNIMVKMTARRVI